MRLTHNPALIPNFTLNTAFNEITVLELMRSYTQTLIRTLSVSVSSAPASRSIRTISTWLRRTETSRGVELFCHGVWSGMKPDGKMSGCNSANACAVIKSRVRMQGVTHITHKLNPIRYTPGSKPRMAGSDAPCTSATNMRPPRGALGGQRRTKECTRPE